MKIKDIKFKLRKFVLGKPFTISVSSGDTLQVGDRIQYGDTPFRILAVDGHCLSVVRVLTLKQRIAGWFIRALEWSPRQWALEHLYQSQGEPGRAQSRYERPAGRYGRGTRT